MGSPFQKIQLSSQPTADDINRIQSNIAQALNGANSPFSGGNLITNISLTTTAKQIAHKLGRTPQVWVICDQQNGASVWRTAWDNNLITLQASADCTVSLWVN